MDSSVSLIIIYVIGLLGLCTSIKNIFHISTGVYLLLCAASAAISTGLWYLYFHQKRWFIYTTILICTCGTIAIIPQALMITGSPYENMIDTDISVMTLAILAVLILFFLFALEFALRFHSVLFLVSIAALVTPPLLGNNLDFVATLMIVVFQISFIVVNMTSRKDRNSFRMTTRGKVSTAACICVTALILLSMIPSLPIESSNEENLFSSVYSADAAIKDGIAMMTGNFESNISGGQISRGNLHQTGQHMLYITTNTKPQENLYLSGFKGYTYADGEWSDAYAFGYVYTDVSFEPFMEPFYRPDNMFTDEPWYRYTCSDLITNLYYTLGYSGKYEASDNNDLATIRIFNISPADTDFYLPYYAGSSAGDLYDAREKAYREGRGVFGYENTFFPRSKMNMSDKWEANPYAEKFVDNYQKYAQSYYTIMPETGNERLKQLCEETPLETLDEITTFIAYTLQTHATYSTTPGTAPFNKDIVDYFLFDNGKGYCVHFASAATLMYRSYGIPARYVTGYSVSPGSFGASPPESSKYLLGYQADVLDYSAHAWVEIFLKDYGWVVVDPTPTATDDMNIIYPGYDKNVMNRIMKEHDWHFKNRSNNSSSSDTEEDDDGDVAQNSFSWIYITSAVLSAGIAAFFLIRRKLRMHLIPTMGSKKLFDLIIRSIHFCGILKDCNGSEPDFSQRLCENIPSLSPDHSAKLINIMLAVNYSNYTHDPDDDDFLRKIYLEITHSLYSNMKWYKKPIYKFIKALI